MNRKLIRIILLGVLVCGLGAIWVAREAIDKMEAAVVDRAAARGVQLDWDKLEWHYDGFTLRQLTASNDRFELNIDRVDIEFDYFRWHHGRPRVQAASVFRPRLLVRDHKADRNKILQPKTSGRQLSHQLLPLKDVGLDRVQVLGGGVTLSRDGTTLVDIELLEANIDLSPRQPQLSLSARYKSLYTGAGAVSVTSTYQPTQSMQRIRTRPLVVGESILQARLGSYFVRVDALELDLDLRDLRKSRLTLLDTQIQTPRFTLELDNWSLEGPFERPSMHLEGVDLRVKSDVANSQAVVKGGPKVDSIDRRTMIPMPKPLVSYLAQGGRLSWARIGVERSGWPTLDNISGSTDSDGANITLDTVGGRVEFEVAWDLYNGSVDTVFWNIKEAQSGACRQ